MDRRRRDHGSKSLTSYSARRLKETKAEGSWSVWWIEEETWTLRKRRWTEIKVKIVMQAMIGNRIWWRKALMGRPKEASQIKDSLGRTQESLSAECQRECLGPQGMVKRRAETQDHSNAGAKQRQHPNELESAQRKTSSLYLCMYSLLSQSQTVDCFVLVWTHQWVIEPR